MSTPESMEAAREWLDELFGLYVGPPRGRADHIASLAALLDKAVKAETERCREAICTMCADNDEYADGYHHFGLGVRDRCRAAAIRGDA